MNIRSAWLVAFIAASILPSVAAFGATIHNELEHDVVVDGDLDLPSKPEEQLRIAAGSLREDLEWAHAYGLDVLVHDQPVCHFYWGFDRRELTGDNYLVIYSQKHEVTCDLCDRDAKLIEFTYGSLPQSVPAYDSPEQTCALTAPES